MNGVSSSSSRLFLYNNELCCFDSWKNLSLQLNDLAQSDGNNAHSDEMSDYVNVKQLPKNLLLLDESQNFFLSAYWDEPSNICKVRRIWAQSEILWNLDDFGK